VLGAREYCKSRCGAVTLVVFGLALVKWNGEGRSGECNEQEGRCCRLQFADLSWCLPGKWADMFEDWIVSEKGE
jgi:hypothetical protein